MELPTLRLLILHGESLPMRKVLIFNKTGTKSIADTLPVVMLSNWYEWIFPLVWWWLWSSYV